MTKNIAPKYLEKMNTVEVESFLASEGPLFIPIGTLEAHGRHLPVGTDTICANGICEELSMRFNGAIAPALGYGITNSLIQTSPGSFFESDLFENFVQAIVDGFYLQGFHKIILVNGHGGNCEVLKKIIRNTSRSKSIAISVIHWWVLSGDFVPQVYSDKPGGHAAIEETAAILYFAPELVKKENFDSKTDCYQPNDGIWLFPPPGEVLLDNYHEGEPNFDQNKANEFMKTVLKDLEDRLSRWLNSIPRLKGGLRP